MVIKEQKILYEVYKTEGGVKKRFYTAEVTEIPDEQIRQQIAAGYEVRIDGKKYTPPAKKGGKRK